MHSIKIRNARDLHALRALKEVDGIELHLTKWSLRGNVPVYAVRYGLWALVEGGVLSIYAPDARSSVTFVPFRLPYQHLVFAAAKASRGLGEIQSAEFARRELTIRRTSVALRRNSWSAGVIFSGSVDEVDYLNVCVESLHAQPEIRGFGEVVICGPDKAAHLMPKLAGVRYLPYDRPLEAGRFLVGDKKNHLLANLTHEKALICHTRIRLRPGALSALPDQFDLITPRVLVRGRAGWLPYLDIGFYRAWSATMQSSAPQPPVFFNREDWQRYLSNYSPYIDGGLFCVNRELALHIPLAPDAAWGEAEDVEWCQRLLFSGAIVELAPNAEAESQTCKTPTYARWGHNAGYRLLRPAVGVVTAARHALA